MLDEHGEFNFYKNLLIYALYIVIIPIIIYDMFLIIQTLIKPGVTPDFFGYKTFSIISGSMEPKININDIVIVKNVDKNQIKINDIITFKIEDETITHRVINIKQIDNKLIYTTKGDSNEVTDIEKIEYNQIAGKYVGKLPKIGKLLSILKNKYIFGLILIFLIIFYMLQRKNIQKKITRKEKRQKYEEQKKSE